MIGPLLWLLYLLTFSDTERAFWHQWFGVNMDFSDENLIFMENLYVFTCNGANHVLRYSYECTL